MNVAAAVLLLFCGRAVFTAARSLRAQDGGVPSTDGQMDDSLVATITGNYSKFFIVRKTVIVQ